MPFGQVDDWVTNLPEYKPGDFKDLPQDIHTVSALEADANRVE